MKPRLHLVHGAWITWGNAMLISWCSCNGLVYKIRSSSFAHWFTRYTAYKAQFFSLNSVVTLKIGSRSPNSDQIVYLSQWYNTWSSVWIHHLVQEVWCRQDFVLLSNYWTFKVPMWPWKWGHGHQNLITSLLCTDGVSVQVWSKSMHWFRR